MISMVILVVINYNDLSKISNVLVSLITHVTMIIKLSIFLIKGKSMLNVEGILRIKMFSRFYERQLVILNEYITNTQRIFFICRVLCCIDLLFYAICPFIEDLDNGLPLPGWIPYEVKKNIYLYIATYIFQMLTITMSAYNNSTFDTVDCMLITVASALFNILEDNMNTLNYHSKNAKKILRNNIAFHIELLRYVQYMELSYQASFCFKLQMFPFI